jgi:hypothetical protein
MPMVKLVDILLMLAISANVWFGVYRCMSGEKELAATSFAIAVFCALAWYKNE